MFKENKEFWLYFVGIVIVFFLLFFSFRSYVGDIGAGFNPIVNTSVDTDGDGDVDTSGTSQVYEAPPLNNINQDLDYFAVIKTNKGDFEIDLLERYAPNTVNNFVFLATDNFYDGTSFHRLIPGVLLQGGSPNTKNEDPSDDKFGGPGYVIKDEINWDSLDLDQGLRNTLINEGYTSAVKIPSKDLDKYSLAMANAGKPNTNGSQFFITLAGTDKDEIDELRGRHTVFATITTNFELIDELAQVQVDDANSTSPRPLEDIIINDIEVFIRYSAQ